MYVIIRKVRLQRVLTTNESNEDINFPDIDFRFKPPNLSRNSASTGRNTCKYQSCHQFGPDLLALGSVGLSSLPRVRARVRQ